MKKHRLHKRLIRNFLYYIEKRYPKISRFLRYHSMVERFETHPDYETISKKIDWFDNRYLDFFKHLNQSGLFEPISEQKITIYTLKTGDYVINGNIKHPVRKTSGKVLRFYPKENLTLTDSYPLPLYRKKEVRGTVVFIPNIENYYHLVLDYLLPSFLHILSNETENNYVTFLTQKRFPLIEIFQEVLLKKNIESTQILIGATDQFTGGQLLLRGSMGTNPQIQSVFPEELKNLNSLIGTTQNDSKHHRIYISRKDANRRKILNEGAMIPILTKYNIEIVELDFNDPKTQIELFRNASLIVSIHGASLTNIIWSRKVKVVEIFPKNLTPIHYLNFSAQLGHEYFYFKGSRANSKENFEVDIQTFDKFIMEIVTQ